jgi:hypothetical protein
MACIEEMRRNVLPYESIEISMSLLALYDAGSRQMLNRSFRSMTTANRQMAVGLVNVDEAFVTSLCIMQEVNEGRMKGEYRLFGIVRVD